MAKKAKVVVDISNLTTEQRTSLFTAVKEISNSFARAEGEKEFVRETQKKISDELQIPKKLVSKLAKVYHKQNFDEVVAEEDQFEKLYLEVTRK